jgi:SnoaL-like protein
MALTADDRVAITDLIHLHGLLADSGQLDRMGDLFTADVVYDVTDVGFGVLAGPAAIREAALALGDKNPVAHHVTNIVLEEIADGRVHAWSKGIAILGNGRCGSATYDDTVVRTDQGWRISRRTIRARRVPLTA